MGKGIKKLFHKVFNKKSKISLLFQNINLLLPSQKILTNKKSSFKRCHKESESNLNLTTTI
ncbi:MAG: hypothetical protein RIQ33_705 [Bacteroidota bacterium]|jgi:hypothetical protein